jgi:arsenate reductase-like glutaredoxin family protein
MHSNRKVYQMRKTTLKKDELASESIQFSEVQKELMREQTHLRKKILAIENRLRFGYSEPLCDYRIELIREDISLSAKIMDELLKKLSL